MTRSYASFSAALQECSDSRVYAGIHWRFDVQTGQEVGRSVAKVIEDRLPALSEPGADRLPEQFFILDCHGPFIAKDEADDAAPDLRRRAKRCRRDVKEMLCLAVGFDQYGEKPTVA